MLLKNLCGTQVQEGYRGVDMRMINNLSSQPGRQNCLQPPYNEKPYKTAGIVKTPLPPYQINILNRFQVKLNSKRYKINGAPL